MPNKKYKVKMANRNKLAKLTKAKKKGKQPAQKHKQPSALYDVDEKVLCYEPDPTKAKVLYDAKVLEVIETETRGKVTREYLIHFQGWNSSWDRYVAEDLVLKDDDTNRALQLELAEKAEAMFRSSGCKSKKRGARKIAEMVRASLKGQHSDDGGECDSANAARTDEESSEESDDDTPVCLIVPNSVREALDLDYFLVNKYEKLTELPAEPNIVQILEEFVKHFGFTQLVAWCESVRNSNRLQSMFEVHLGSSSRGCNDIAKAMSNMSIGRRKMRKNPLKPLYRRLQVVKQIADGCRIYIDFLIHRVLLYSVEQVQFLKSAEKMPHYNPTLIQPADYQVTVKSEPEDSEPEAAACPPAKKKLTRGRAHSSASSRPTVNYKKLKPKVVYPLTAKIPKLDFMIAEYKQKLIDWTLVPSSMYERVPSTPSLIYGVNHLLRLFVKLPELLGQTNMPRRRMNLILYYATEMMEWIMMKRFYGTHLYIPATNALKRTGRRRTRQVIPQVKTEPYSTDDEHKWVETSTLDEIKIKIEKP